VRCEFRSWLSHDLQRFRSNVNGWRPEGRRYNFRTLARVHPSAK
jgi:hypothetical protein